MDSKNSYSSRYEIIGLILALLMRMDDMRTLSRIYARVNRAFVTDGQEV